MTIQPIINIRPDQWHLHNTGQTGGIAGIDVNVLPVWKDYTGTGVKVLVFDTGIDTNHPDLVGNYRGDLSYEFTTHTNDGHYSHFTPVNAHGTFVSGLIAADGKGTGTLGVAFGATFSAYVNFNGDGAYTAFAKAAHAGFDVMNNSWGGQVPFQLTFNNNPALQESVLDAITTGRDGLGLNILFAAGNNYSWSGLFERLGFEWTGLSSFADVNTDSLQNSRHIITIGSVDHDGTYSEPGDAFGYTTPGAAVLVSAPGTNVLSTDILGDLGYGPDDTVLSSGTSFATPITSGIVALMLNANAALGYRDVKEILAYSARHIDPEEPSWVVNGATNHNGGGLLSNYSYGFGMVDATAAVRLAETWTKQSIAANEVHVGKTYDMPVTDIPDDGTIEFKFELDAGVSIETIELDIHLRHEEIGDLNVILISPNATQSTLLYRPADGRVSQILKAVHDIDPDETSPTELKHTLTSNDFMGEDSSGTWTLRVTDAKAGDTGALYSLNLRAYGSEQSDNKTYIYTNDFAMIANRDTARTTLDNSMGTHTLNLAAVSDAVRVDLSTGTAKIAGTDLTIASGTTIGTIFTGDGDDLVTLAPAGGTVSLGRGNDTVMLSATGTVDGGRGFDRIVLTDNSASYAIVDHYGAVTLTHKQSGAVVNTSNVQYFAFGTAANDALIFTANAVEAQIARFYDLVLGRTADFEGLGYWIGRAAEGAGVSAIASAFAASDEFGKLAASLSDNAFVDLLYTHILRRTADQDGASYWLNRVADGVSRVDIATSFALSDEASNVAVDHVRLINLEDTALFY